MWLFTKLLYFKCANKKVFCVERYYLLELLFWDTTYWHQCCRICWCSLGWEVGGYHPTRHLKKRNRLALQCYYYYYHHHHVFTWSFNQKNFSLHLYNADQWFFAKIFFSITPQIYFLIFFTGMCFVSQSWSPKAIQNHHRPWAPCFPCFMSVGSSSITCLLDVRSAAIFCSQTWINERKSEVLSVLDL
jgi:hypothetical protein